MNPEKNYAGLKVLDFSRVLTGPYLTMMLCDLGAEVVKIERPFKGADERGFGPFRECNGRKQSGYYMMLNRGKKSVVLDLSSPESKEIVYKLAEWAEVVVENFKPGVIKKLGFGYDDLKKVNPKIIYCSISTFGQEGPLSKRAGYDIIAQATSGLMWTTGDPHGPPQRSGTSIGDVNAAAHALGAIGAALYYREKTGRGQYIDISMRDCLSAIMETMVVRYTISNGEDNPLRTGCHHALQMPYGIYNAGKGRYIVLAALTDSQWDALCELMGKVEWGAQPKFQGCTTRGKNQVEVIETIEKWLQSFDDIQELIRILDSGNVPNTLVYTIADLVNDPQYLMRNNLVEVNDPIAGPFKSPTTPMLFSETSVWNPVPAPILGGNTSEVLREIVGLPEDRITAIVERNGAY